LKSRGQFLSGVSLLDWLKDSKGNMVYLLFILLLISPGIYSDQDPDPEKAKFGDELFAIDLVECQPISKRFGWGLGYDNIEVKGKEKHRCLIRLVTVWEADYKVVQCRIKPSLERLAVIKGPLYDVGFKQDVRKYCKLVETGHLRPFQLEP
jgi:hypothetical protein